MVVGLQGDDEDNDKKDMKDEELLTLVLGLISVMMRMMTGRMWSMRSLSPWS